MGKQGTFWNVDPVSADFPVPFGPRDTSEAAAKAIAERVPALRQKVYDFIASKGLGGATDEEVCDALKMIGSTERPRRIELVEAGKVVESGQRRPTKSGRQAIVWIAQAALDGPKW